VDEPAHIPLRRGGEIVGSEVGRVVKVKVVVETGA